MNKFITAIALILASFQTFADDIKIIDYKQASFRGGITVIEDDERGVICYIYREGGGIGGISCLPMKEIVNKNK